jgi:S-adenosylmethionine decarboxylase
MAYHDTLFQLGMDLTRSSTAQKEDLGEAAPTVAHDVHPAHRCSVRQGIAPAVPPTSDTAPATVATHVTIDVYGSGLLRDIKTAVATLTRLVDDAGASLQHLHVHPVAENGALSGVAALADGHIAFHSRPAAGYAAIDVATFGGAAPHVWALAAKAVFDDARIATRVLTRGETAGEAILSAVLPPQRGRSQVKAVRRAA